jgi:hypothetical protein
MADAVARVARINEHVSIIKGRNMARKPPPAKKKTNAKKPPPRMAPPAMQKKGAKRPKPKMPTLGGGLMGLGGTGAGGMLP